MKKLHAVGAGIVGVVLSATAALAATPHGALPSGTTSQAQAASSTSAVTNELKPTDNHGPAVSAVAQDETQVGGPHHNHGGAVSPIARETHGPSNDPATTDAGTNSQKPTDNHGAAVSAVATDSTQVGGKHTNHGGAVSAVAHGTHGPNEHANGHASDH